MEAIVEEQHPALAPPRPYGRPNSRSAAYPYEPRPLQFPQQRSELEQFTSLVESIAGGVQQAAQSLSRAPDYVVPKRFGMSAILGIMTALAGVFGVLRFVNAEPFFYAFFAIQSLTICLAQMFYGKTPRLASTVAGAVILPLFTIVASRFSENLNAEEIVCMTIGFVPFGALLGYITGTCAAGVFLVMDAAENYFKGQPVLDHRPRPAP